MRYRVFSSLFLSVVLLFSSASYAQPGLNKVEGGFADLVENLSPAVVNISTTQKIKSAPGIMGRPFRNMPGSPEFEPFHQFFDQFEQLQPKERDVQSLGSGFIVSAEGFVVTNNHVVAKADEITVTLSNNQKFTAEIIGRDPKTDLALLKIEGNKPFPYVSLGDSDQMRVGDWVIAIGNPFGLGGSVTKGIISARQRSINTGPFDDFLQIDAPINRGNSGGPLFNLNGDVIGINTAIFSPSGGSVGIGFAIPSALAKPVIAQLKEFGRTHRGWLGVKIQEVSEEVADSLGLPEARGALVLGVGKGSPAGKAGIKQGDVILTYNGKKITEMRFLPRMVAETKIGATVSLGIWRQGGVSKLHVVIGESEEAEDEEGTKPSHSKKNTDKGKSSQSFLGMELVPLNATIRRQLRVEPGASGLAVVGMTRGSPAARRGVRKGDIIHSVNNVVVAGVGDMKAQLEAAHKKGRKFVLVVVRRGKEDVFITLPAAEAKK